MRRTKSKTLQSSDERSDDLRSSGRSAPRLASFPRSAERFLAEHPFADFPQQSGVDPVGTDRRRQLRFFGVVRDRSALGGTIHHAELRTVLRMRSAPDCRDLAIVVRAHAVHDLVKTL